MATIIDGKAVSTKVKDEVKDRVIAYKERTGKDVGLAVIMVGDNPASEIYVRNKIRACEYTGIKSYSYKYDDISQDDLIALVNELNKNDDIHGILVQLPLPKTIDEDAILSAISPSKDVDGFSAESIGNLALGKPGFRSCTPSGVMRLFAEYNVDLTGKNAVVIGRSNIVGKPLSFMLLEKNATVTICHSKTANLTEIVSKADVVCACLGRAKFVTADMVKDGAVVIDVGINKLDGKTVGDVDYENVFSKASAITPVPGGVGPMTIAMLMQNTVISAEIAEKNAKR